MVLFTPTVIGDELSSDLLNAQLAGLQQGILDKYPSMRLLVALTSLGANNALIDINSIPQTCNHLRLILQLRSTLAGTTPDSGAMYFNNSRIAANYFSTNRRITTIYTVASDLAAGVQGEVVFYGVQPAGAPASQFTPCIIDILNYRSTALWKMVQGYTGVNSDADDANSAINIFGGGWNVTSAITRIGLISNSASNWLLGSSYSLYGYD